MYCRYLILMPLMALAPSIEARDLSAVRAQSAQPSDAQAQDPTQDQMQDPAQRQRRRALLRQTLRAQQDDVTANVRQMSLQERSTMRQQMRQQPEWSK